MNTPQDYMKRAIELAKKGWGYTSPNPMVGCVVVKDGRIIAEGYHERIGGYHAERNALLSCKEDAQGAELYVTLEPCCHYGKTPPCTEIIMEKKIAKVYIGAMDNNPLVAGKGAAILREAGIAVETGILEKECRQLNEVFFHYMEHKTPFVAMKYAMTLDGRIACDGGDSKWVTGEEARTYVHTLRKGYRGIMGGINTVLADDPMLNCRIEQDVDPIRIVCDSSLRIPLDSNIVKTAKEIPTYVAYAAECENDNQDAFAHKKETLQAMGVKLLKTAGQQVDVTELMQLLGKENIDSILLEGGTLLNGSMLQAHLVHRVYAFVAPKLVGGTQIKSPVTGDGIKWMKDAIELEDTSLQTFGKDIMITGVVK